MGKSNVEYASDQITVYPTCPFKCRYCWAQDPLFQYRIRNPRPFEEVKRYINARKPRTIMISFTTDPYQPREKEELKTAKLLDMLINTPHIIMILTKSDLARRDFDIIKNRKNVWLGSTVTSLFGIPDEPYAPPNDKRIAMLRDAHDLGINTFMSIEPWIPNVTYPVEIIKHTHHFIDYYIIGRLDYETKYGYPKIPKGYYQKYIDECLYTLLKLKKMFHFKKQLIENP